MCLNPIHSAGHSFACRSCNECVETRLNSWVVRALAESSIAGFTYAITMTYSNLPNGSKPIGATVFCYPDIQRFLKHIRSAYKRFYKQTGEIRYIACGEQGSKGSQRVHWHVILFTDRDIRPVIKWVDFETQKPVAPMNVVTDRNYNTDAWPHGHILLQKPDKKGIRYALKYALKGQVGVAKSLGTNRLPKAEVWAASFFRMSKKPPIGMRFLEKLVADAKAGNYIYPSIKIAVPLSDGFWFLNGLFALYWVTQMQKINEAFRSEHGYNLHTWDALLTEVENYESERDLTELTEVLRYGETLEERPVDSEAGTPEGGEGRYSLAKILADEYIARLSAGLSDNQKNYNNAARFSGVVRSCGGFLPCKGCQRGLVSDEKNALKRAYAATLSEWWQADPSNPERFGTWQSPEFRSAFDKRWRKLNSAPSPWCRLIDTSTVVEAFAHATRQRHANERLGKIKSHGYQGTAPGFTGGIANRYGDREARAYDLSRSAPPTDKGGD